MWKNKKLNIVCVAFCPYTFQVGGSFYQRLFCTFFQKDRELFNFRVLGYTEGLLLKMEYFTKNCPWISGGY